LGGIVKLIPITALSDKPRDAARFSSFFHMVNRLLPDGQIVLAIPPEMPAGDALKLMKEKGYSQLPVRAGQTVLGLFTYRAFALEVAQMAGKEDPTKLPVEEFLEHEKVTYARLQDEFRSLIEALDARDAVVVSGPDDLVAILTPMDVLRYLYTVANAFVLIEEIELSLRTLILAAVKESGQLAACIKNALSDRYKERSLPGRLEDLTFDEYVALLRDGRNWDQFKAAFGGTRDLWRGRLERVRELRNDVFHFRRELSVDDHQALAAVRDRLLRSCRTLDAVGDTP